MRSYGAASSPSRLRRVAAATVGDDAAARTASHVVASGASTAGLWAPAPAPAPAPALMPTPAPSGALPGTDTPSLTSLCATICTGRPTLSMRSYGAASSPSRLRKAAAATVGDDAATGRGHAGCAFVEPGDPSACTSRHCGDADTKGGAVYVGRSGSSSYAVGGRGYGTLGGGGKTPFVCSALATGVLHVKCLQPTAKAILHSTAAPSAATNCQWRVFACCFTCFATEAVISKTMSADGTTCTRSNGSCREQPVTPAWRKALTLMDGIVCHRRTSFERCTVQNTPAETRYSVKRMHRDANTIAKRTNLAGGTSVG